MFIIIGIYIFLDILTFLVFVDVILSWLTLVGLNIRPKFLADIIDPIYNYIKKIIPTTIGPLDLTPIVIILILGFLKSLIFAFFPEVYFLIQNFS